MDHPSELVHHGWLSREEQGHARAEQRLHHRRSRREQPDHYAPAEWRADLCDGRRCADRTVRVSLRIHLLVMPAHAGIHALLFEGSAKKGMDARMRGHDEERSCVIYQHLWES